MIFDFIKKYQEQRSEQGIVFDDFNRSNAGALGNAVTGQVWQPLFSNYSIANNLAVPASAGALVVIDAGISNCSVEAEFIYNGYSSLLGRVTNVNTFYNARIGSSSLDLFRVTSGTSTNLGSYIFTPIAGAIYKIKTIYNGNNIKVYLNDVLRIEANDSTYPTLTRYGIYRFGTFSTSDKVDNFKIVAL